jgi:hypothetical protein
MKNETFREALGSLAFLVSLAWVLWMMLSL